MAGKHIPTQGKAAQTLLDRLERISADSPWAHQASGIRAALAKKLTRSDLAGLETLLDAGYEILEKAAAEIPPAEEGRPPVKR